MSSVKLTLTETFWEVCFHMSKALEVRLSDILSNSCVRLTLQIKSFPPETHSLEIVILNLHKIGCSLSIDTMLKPQ